MTSKIATGILKKVAGKQAQQYETPSPHYETYVDDSGRTRQRKRALPTGLTPAEEKLLKKIRRRAHYLDKGISLCGFRVGWTFFLGLIPFAGDIVNVLLGYNLIIKQAKRGDVPALLISKMQLNTLAAAGMGLIPILGDIIMAVYKPNSRNALLFEEFLVQRATTRGSGAGPAQDRITAEQVLDRADGASWSKSQGTNPALGRAPPLPNTPRPVVRQ